MFFRLDLCPNLVRLTVRAQAVGFEQVAVDAETGAGLQFGDQRRQAAGVELERTLAAGTNQVVVRAGGRQCIAHDGAAEGGRLADAQPRQQIQRAVDRSPADLGRLRLHRLHHLRRGQVGASGQGLDDGAAGRRQTRIGPTQGLEGKVGRLGHGSGRRQMRFRLNYRHKDGRYQTTAWGLLHQCLGKCYTVAAMSTQQVDYSNELRRFAIFGGLTPDQMRTVRVQRPPTVRSQVTLFKQGDLITGLFLILDGAVELAHSNEQGVVDLKRTVGPGQVLGRMELDTPDGQLGTAKTVRPTELLFIDKSILQQLRSAYAPLSNQLDRSEVIGNLRAAPYFAPLTDPEIKWLSDIATLRTVPADTAIYRRNEPAAEAFVLRQGRVRIEPINTGDIRWISAGSVFGERSAIETRYRQANAITETLCHVFVLPAADLRAVIERHPQGDWFNEPINVAQYLSQTPFLQQLDRAEVRRLAGYTMQIHLSQPYRTVVRQGLNDEYFYVLVRGSASAQGVDEKGAPMQPLRIERGATFGETSVLLGDPARTTVETLIPSDWLRIQRTDFARFLAAHPNAEGKLTIDADTRRRMRGLRRMFEWQEEGEIVLLKTYRHWLVLLRNLLSTLAFMLALLVGREVFILIFKFDELLVDLGLALVLVFPVLVAIWVIIDYLNDYYVVTSRRVARQEKLLFIRERRFSTPLDKIQEVSLERQFWARLFGYGHLRIKTAATAGEARLDFLPNPTFVEKLLRQESSRSKVGAQAASQETIRHRLQDRLHLGLEERLPRRALPAEGIAPVLAHPAGRRSWRQRLGLQQDTENKLVWRRHWLGLIAATLLPFFATLFMLVLAVLYFSGVISTGIAGPARTLLSFLVGFLLLASGSWLWWTWADWRNDTYTVGDQYVERVEKKPLFFDERHTVTALERIQNVDFRRPNPFAFLFDFGDVFIQTAAEKGFITFRFVPQPDRVQTEILRRMEQWQEMQMGIRRRQSQNELEDWFEAYHQLVLHDFIRT